MASMTDPNVFELKKITYIPLSRRKLSLFFMPPLIEWVVQLKTLFRLWMTECKRPGITKLAPPEPELPEPAREPLLAELGVRRPLDSAELGVCRPLPVEMGVCRPLKPAEFGVLISALLTPICF